MAGLRTKVFTVNPETGEAVNFYVQESGEAAQAFFTEELIDRISGLYGVRPARVCPDRRARREPRHLTLPRPGAA